MHERVFRFATSPLHLGTCYRITRQMAFIPRSVILSTLFFYYGLTVTVALVRPPHLRTATRSAGTDRVRVKPVADRELKCGRPACHRLHPKADHPRAGLVASSWRVWWLRGRRAWGVLARRREANLIGGPKGGAVGPGAAPVVEPGGRLSWRASAIPGPCASSAPRSRALVAR
jgi:hypothetical protein